MSTAHAVAVAVIFTWLGMVVAISFIEAPLKFRAPGVSLQIGLAIGRLVFRALNVGEVILAVVLLTAIGAGPPSPGAVVAVCIAVGTLAVQLLVVRPRLTRRSELVLAGPAGPPALDDRPRRSRVHYGYVGLELVKVIALIIGGAAVLAG